jgi:4-amino-4-deoxy-L-arabinose transferase-like glycosyltransferase
VLGAGGNHHPGHPAGYRHVVSRRQLLALVLLALTARVLYNVIVLADYTPASDAHHYHDIARNLADGHGFASTFPFSDAEPQATAFRPPLFPAVLGAFYAIFGVHVGVAQALNVTLGIGVVVLASLVTCRMAGVGAALAVGAVVAIYPPLLANDGPPLAEPLSLCLLLLGVLLLLQDRPFAAGAVTGLQVLAKPSAQGLVLVLAAWVVWHWGWRRALTFLAPAVIVIVPWVVRNELVMGSPVLVTSNGFNLAALYSPQSKEAGAWLDPVNDSRFEEVRRDATAAEDEVALDETLRGIALDELRAHPFDLIERSARNAVRSLDLFPGENDGAERLDGRSVPFRYATLWLTWMVFGAGVAGLARARRAPATRLLVLCTMYFTVISIPFSPMAPRLRAPLDLVCCVGAGVVLHRLTSRSVEEEQGDAEIIDLTDAAMARATDQLPQHAAAR